MFGFLKLEKVTSPAATKEKKKSLAQIAEEARAEKEEREDMASWEAFEAAQRKRLTNVRRQLASFNLSPEKLTQAAEKGKDALEIPIHLDPKWKWASTGRGRPCNAHGSKERLFSQIIGELKENVPDLKSRGMHVSWHCFEKDWDKCLKVGSSSSGTPVPLEECNPGRCAVRIKWGGGSD